MKVLFALTLSLCALTALAQETPAFTTEFDRARCTFATVTSHPYFPLWPGYRLTLEGKELDDEDEEVEVRSQITVLPDTEIVDGVTTRVVEHRQWEDDELIEVSRDFYAVCRETGAVWYFGESVTEYEDGDVVGHPGEWRAGMDGARAGIIMPGMPLLGARYQQEFAPGIAEDRGEIVGIGETVTVPAGTFTDVIQIIDSNALEPGVAEPKFYAHGVGLIQDEAEKLIAIVPPPCRPDDTTLCLSDGRFRVQSSWRTTDGSSGAGHASTLTSDSGTFWFFGPDNIELTVKVLNACEGFGNQWVFAAGLTDVEVVLTVTDTESGAVRVYDNPLGRPFVTITDTSAFSACH